MRATNTVDVAALIDDNKVSAFQVRVLLLCAIIIIVDGFDIQAIGYIAPTIAKEWALKPGALGPVFSAALFGMMIGALGAGPLADRFGRKTMTLACTALFGVCSLLTVFAYDIPSLAAIRFITGLGLGGVMPNTIALTAEYSPARKRATMITIMFCGQSVGSIFGGALAAKMVPYWGWKSIFVVGGVVPLVLVALLAASLPESLHMLAKWRDQGDRIRAILARMMPEAVFPADAQFIVPKEGHERFPVTTLFTEGRTLMTVLLWIIFASNLLVIAFFFSWLPSVFASVGLPLETAIYVSTVYHFGAVLAALTIGWFIDKFGAFRILGFVFLAAGGLVVAIGAAGNAVSLIVPLIFCAGYCIVGAQNGANAASSLFYPSNARSTGIGWALGMGRVGSIIGPLSASYLIAQQFSAAHVFQIVGAVPEFLAAACAFALLLIPGPHRRAPAAATAPKAEA